MRASAAGAAIVLAGGLAVIASGTTGAFFSETKDGSISGSIGAVHLSTTETTLNWANMMPGKPEVASVDFWNTGTDVQDFYLVFPNRTALSALNDLGEYGEVHIAVNGVETFASKNLNDGYPCGTPGNPGVATLCAVPEQILLASDVPVGGQNNFSFQFNYAGKLGTATKSSGGVGVFNTYPVPGQTTVIPTETGAGLPFQVVAVQPDQKP